MKNLYLLILITFASCLPQIVKAQNGCITCALSEILRDEWRKPSAGGTGGGGTFGWTFNLRDRFGRKVVDKKLKELEKKMKKSNVQKVQRLVTTYVNQGLLKVRIVPHIITLKSGEPYVVYQRYIEGFSN